ncbi:hypothetical protein D3C80_1929890 [compost metagenome]
MLVSFFFMADPKNTSSGSPRTTPVRDGTETQDVAVLSAADDSICCVYPQCSDPARRGKYCRFVYSLCVVHFRKI